MNNNRKNSNKTPLHGVSRNLSMSMKDLRVKRQERLKEIGQAQMKPRPDGRTDITAGIMKTSIPKNLKLLEELQKTESSIPSNPLDFPKITNSRSSSRRSPEGNSSHVRGGISLRERLAREMSQTVEMKAFQHRKKNSNTLPHSGFGLRVVQPDKRTGNKAGPSPPHSSHPPGPSSHPSPQAASLLQADTPSNNLRPIVLDGSNICMALGKGEVRSGSVHVTIIILQFLYQDFLTEGLHLVYDWFARRGHEVLIILPQSRKSKLMGKGRIEEVVKLDDLEKSGILFYSPSRRTDERSWDCYDDVFIVDIAARKKGIVVSNDNFRDVLDLRNEDFSEQIKTRYYRQFCFILAQFPYLRKQFCWSKKALYYCLKERIFLPKI